jgi:hypothetical protein
MQISVRLQEGNRTSRRTIADALEVVRQQLGLNEITRARIEIVPLQLPSGECTALVDVVFPEYGCRVSLPTSARFKALNETGSPHTLLEIYKLNRAEVCSDGWVQLTDGTRLRAVEVVPTHLPYELSDLEKRILRHVISLTRADNNCYRSIRRGLPEHLQQQVPDLRNVDYVIRAYIEDNDPVLRVSNQKIADALATCGVRIPSRRRSRKV